MRMGMRREVRNPKKFRSPKPEMRPSILPVSLLVVSLCGCGNKQTSQIADVTKPATLQLTTAPQQGTSVHNLSLRIRGQIDGVAYISGTILSTQRISGEFDIKAGGDYYTTNCIVQYSPEQVKSGRVAVKYEFRTID